LVVQSLYDAVVPIHGWSPYWMILTGMNCITMIIFFVGYKGLPKPTS